MPTFFVTIIELYRKGFNTLEELDEESINNFQELRKNTVEGLLKRQFELSYHTNMTKEDTDNLIPFELDYLYNLLVEQKNAENEAIKKQTK